MDAANPGFTPQQQPSSLKPLTINMMIDGREAEKTIMGNVTDDEVILEFKHTNDLHGYMAQAATLIKPEDFWADSGDAWQDFSFSSSLVGGQKEVEIMNLRDCDIATTGNHLYDDDGLEGGKNLIEASRFPYVSSNTEGMLPYVMSEVEGIKIAFVGVRTSEKKMLMVDPSLVKDLKITDPIEGVRKSVKEAREKGADAVIVLSHLGLKLSPEFRSETLTDKDLAAQVPGIDLILGGHSHTPTFEKVEVNGTRIVQGGLNSVKDIHVDDLYMGTLTLAINRHTGHVTSITHTLIPIDRTAPVDMSIRRIENRYKSMENAVLGEKLGTSPAALTHELKAPEDTSLGNLITDAMRKETGADVALLDSNFFSNRKNSATTVLPNGNLTLKDLTALSPWMGKSIDARVETWDVRGEELRLLLEEGVKKLLSPDKGQGLYQVSGLTMTYDPAGPEGRRITEVAIGGEPLNAEKKYRLTTTYVIGNWNPIFSHRDEQAVKDGPKVRILLRNYLKNGDFPMPEVSRIHRR